MASFQSKSNRLLFKTENQVIKKYDEKKINMYRRNILHRHSSKEQLLSKTNCVYQRQSTIKQIMNLFTFFYIRL